jgi:DNA-binding NarL/FixJ family response regulator
VRATRSFGGATTTAARPPVGEDGAVSNDTDVPLEVMVVDDHPGFRAAVRASLALDGRCRASLEASSVAEALSLLDHAAHLPDLVLLDVNLGDPHLGAIDGMRGAAMIVERHPALPVLLCSTAPLDELPPMPRHAHVTFSPKELLDGDVLVDAVRSARSG